MNAAEADVMLQLSPSEFLERVQNAFTTEVTNKQNLLLCLIIYNSTVVSLLLFVLYSPRLL